MIGIVVILMGIAIVAINPMRQFAMANNSRRWANTTAILSAVSQNIIDNRGIWCPTGDPLPTLTNPCMGDSGQTPTAECASYYDICDCLVPRYISELPVDPTAGSWTDCTTYNTYYQVIQDATTGRVTVSAPNAQSQNGVAPVISVTR